MLADEAKTAYIAALNAIIAADTIVGPIFAERATLQAQEMPDRARISDITNQINNTASAEVQAALKALRTVR